MLNTNRQQSILQSLGIKEKTYIEYVRKHYENIALQVILPYCVQISTHIYKIDKHFLYGVYESIAVNHIKLTGIEKYTDFSQYEVHTLFRAILAGMDIAFYCELNLDFNSFWDIVHTYSHKGISTPLVYRNLFDDDFSE